MSRLVLLLGVGVLASAVAFAVVPAEQSEAPPNRKPSLLRTIEHEGIAFDVVEIPLEKYEIRAEWRPGGMHLRHAGGEVRTNAGIFEPDFRPTGLLVASGKVLAPLNAGSGKGNFYLAPNGVFAIRDGGAVVEETSEYVGDGVILATQSGPLLVRRGRLHPAFRKGSSNLAIRNAVGIRDPSHVVLVISREPVTLWTLSQFLRDELGCADALYLDGVISGLWAAGAGRDQALEKGPFAGVLTVHPRGIETTH